jgi:hypothetical protein
VGTLQIIQNAFATETQSLEDLEEKECYTITPRTISVTAPFSVGF